MKKTCTFKGCEKDNEHIKNRITNSINVNPVTGCWIWMRTRNGYGYGMMTIDGKTALSHRVAYTSFIGNVGRQQVLHKCDNPSCCNPDHLFLGTQSDNMKDCQKKGRIKIPHPIFNGSTNPSAKLNENDVLNIRSLLGTGITQDEIAKHYKVSQATISAIATRSRWSKI